MRVVCVCRCRLEVDRRRRFEIGEDSNGNESVTGVAKDGRRRRRRRRSSLIHRARVFSTPTDVHFAFMSRAGAKTGRKPTETTNSRTAERKQNEQKKKNEPVRDLSPLLPQYKDLHAVELSKVTDLRAETSFGRLDYLYHSGPASR